MTADMMNPGTRAAAGALPVLGGIEALTIMGETDDKGANAAAARTCATIRCRRRQRRRHRRPDRRGIGASGGHAGASYVVFGFRTGGTSTTEASVAASPDDAEQAGARVQLASNDLDIGDDYKLVGLRFTGLEVPDGATITNAHIEFQARLTGGGPADLTIAVEDTADAANFGSGGTDIAHRDYLDQATAWSPEPWVEGESYQTADLAVMLAALVGADGIDADDALAFRLSGAGERTAWSFDGQGEAPRLVSEYEGSSRILRGSPRPHSFNLDRHGRSGEQLRPRLYGRIG